MDAFPPKMYTACFHKVFNQYMLSFDEQYQTSDKLACMGWSNFIQPDKMSNIFGSKYCCIWERIPPSIDNLKN